MKTIYTIVFMFLCGISLLCAQEAKENWQLNSSESGNKNYVAREYISLKPGFSYKATSGNTFRGRIDQTLLFPPTANTYAKPDGTITTSSTEGAVVGNLSGAFDVSPSGAATYSVPIECPPGIQGMQPNISLVYNSQSGSGTAGMCWNLGGLSMISRVPKNYYYDNEKSGIIWNDTSPLALDGQRLIKIHEWSTDSIEYRTESGIDRIIGYNIGTRGPSFFKIYTKEGRILTYGSPDSDTYFYSLSKSMGIIYHLGWFLYRITDMNNNFIEFTYTRSESKFLWVFYYYSDNRIEKIKYGHESSGSKQIIAGIHFQYKAKTSNVTQYIGGESIENQFILDKVEVKGINDELQETYQLSYDSQDGNDFLTELKRINASGEFIHPLKFEWYPMDYSHEYDDNIRFSATPSFTALDGNDANFTPASYGDFDGDGLTDVVMRANLDDWTKNLWIVYRNTGNGFFQFKYEETLECPEKYDVKENTFLFLDLLDGDGKDELYVGRVTKIASPLSYKYRLDCYKYIDDDFQRYPDGDLTHSTSLDVYDERGALHAVPGDFIGKGTSQFIIFSTNNAPRFYLTTLSLPNGLPNDWGSGKSKILLSDINGNGKTEIAYIKRNADNTYDATTVFYEYGTDGEEAFGALLTSSLFHYNDNIFNGDFNGDGNTDFLVRTPYQYGGGSWKLLISSGKGFIETSMSSFIKSDADPGDISVADVNKDGKSDIVLAEPNFTNGSASSSTLKVLVNTGGDTFTENILDASFVLPSGLFAVSSKFKTSHGQDFFWAANWSIGGPQILTLCKNKWFNKINKIENSFGEQTTISYKDNRNPYPGPQKIMTADNGEIESVLNNFLPQLEVVNTVTATNTNLSYTFENTFLHKEGRGFLGFGKITIADAVKTITQVSESQHNASFHILYPYKTTTKLTNGTLISETTSDYSIVNNGNKKYFLRPGSTVSTDYLKNTDLTISYSDYDGERNPQTITTDFGNGITSIENLRYVSRGSQFLNKVSYKKITQKATGQPDVNRENYFFYDNKGNITLHTQDSLDVNKVQTFYGNYDKYGNAQKITVVANGISRSQTLTYSSSGRFVKTNKDDQLNQTVTYSYNESKGLVTDKTDRLGTTGYQYDNWGRLALTTYPDGIKTANTLQWAGSLSGKPSGAKYYSYSETSGESPVTVWYDALGREMRNESYGLNRNRIWVDTEYNTKGQLYRVSEPYFTTGTKTWAATHTYDSYGRVTQTVTPMGTTSYTYSNLTATVVSPSGTNSTTTNAAGWTVSQTANGKRVDFTRYASGLVKTATPEGGQAISMEYDLQGNRTKLTDPDAGTVTTQYDGWGQLLLEKQIVHVPYQYKWPLEDTGALFRTATATANLPIEGEVWGTVTTAWNYLPSGLLNYKLRNGERTNYGYDSSHRLKWISIAGKHAQGFDYDQWDRIIQTRDTVENSKVFVRKTEYDALGRISGETHPDGYYVTSFYDKYSYLTQVKDPGGTLIWQAKESNARGQLTKTQSGSKETVFGFDSKGFPASIVTSGITNLAYSFNTKGNLYSRQDNIAGYKEIFTYDNLNRLYNWDIRNNSNASLGSQSIAYNSTTGNITSKSDLNSYTMNYGGNGRPHALTSITGTPGAIPSVDQTVSYTDFKKVKTITEGNNSLTVAYGVDEQRVKTVLNKNGTSLTRYYMGNYEEETVGNSVRKIHYLSGGNGLAAVYVQNAGKDTLYYAHTDYQGSLTALSLSNGTVIERYAYDPWGKRRNPTNWSQADTRTAFILNRGYTMHEHLPEFNLINMNGRVYDPLTAMFFSPDPYLQAPGNWLNYNRYGYCLNNPMLYTDPSGEFLGLAFRAMSFLGGSLSNWINGYDDPVGKAWKSSGRLTNEVSNCAQVTVYKDNNTLITAGLDPFALGASANVVHTENGHTFSGSIGYGFLGGFNVNAGYSYSNGSWTFGASAGVGQNYWGWNASATYKDYGVGYGRTYYGEAIGPDGLSNAQTVGSATLFWDGGSFTLQNDVDYMGDGHDRWRTNAFELTIGDFSFGNSIYTNDGEVASTIFKGQKASVTNLWSSIWGKNRNANLSAWRNGKVYSAPTWIGLRTGNRIERIGYSFPGAQDLFQNGVHGRTSFGKQNYYLDYTNFRTGIYLYTGYYSPYSLWGY